VRAAELSVRAVLTASIAAVLADLEAQLAAVGRLDAIALRARRVLARAQSNGI